MGGRTVPQTVHFRRVSEYAWEYGTIGRWRPPEALLAARTGKTAGLGVLIVEQGLLPARLSRSDLAGESQLEALGHDYRTCDSIWSM